MKKYTAEQIREILSAFDREEKYGTILRAKGYVQGENGSWIYFDYVPEEANVREGSPAAIGKVCVIGADICCHSLEELFGIKE